MNEWDDDPAAQPGSAPPLRPHAPRSPEGFNDAPAETPAQRRARERSSRPKLPTPVISYTLIAINVAVYLFVMAIAKAPDQSDVLIKWSLTNAVANGEWWRLFTCAFLHAGIWHIGMNMVFLYQIGRLSENMLGRGRFLLLYVLSLIGSSLLSFSYHAWLADQYYSLGASGAEMGLYFGFTGYIVAIRRTLRPGIMRLVIKDTVIFFVLNAVVSAVWHIDNAAHAGGGIVGFALGFGYGLTPPLYDGLAVKMRWAWTVLLLVALTGMAVLLLPAARVNEAKFALKDAQDAATQSAQDQAARNETGAIDNYNALLPDFDQVQACLKTYVPPAEAHRRYERLRDRAAKFLANPNFQDAFKTNAELKKCTAGLPIVLPALRALLCSTELRRIALEGLETPPPDEPGNPQSPPHETPAQRAAELRALEAWPEFQAELKANRQLQAQYQVLHDLLPRDSATPAP